MMAYKGTCPSRFPKPEMIAIFSFHYFVPFQQMLKPALGMKIGLADRSTRLEESKNERFDFRQYLFHYGGFCEERTQLLIPLASSRFD